MHKRAMERLSGNLSVDFLVTSRILLFARLSFKIEFLFSPLSSTFLLSVFIFQVLYKSNWEFTFVHC